MHFTPTSSSWLNMVERFFADLAEGVIRSGSFTSVKNLIDDINAYLAERNANPKPYKWVAKGEEILEPRKIRCDELHKGNRHTSDFVVIST
jgi:hypothetical protein